MSTPPDADREPTIRASSLEDIPISELSEPLTWDEVQRRREATNDGTHAWTINLIYQLTDPETALDDMVLGSDQLVGLGPIYCFWCHQDYPRDGTGPALNATACPGRPAGQEPAP